jgi:hypothetical protein
MNLSIASVAYQNKKQKNSRNTWWEERKQIVEESTLFPIPKDSASWALCLCTQFLREPQLYKTPETVSGRNWNPRIFFLCKQTDSIDFLAKKRMELAVNTVYWQLCSQTSWKCFLTSKLPPPPLIPPPHRFFSSFHKPQRQTSTLPKLSETSCPDRDLHRNLWVAKKRKEKKRKKTRQDMIWTYHVKLILSQNNLLQLQGTFGVCCCESCHCLTTTQMTNLCVCVCVTLSVSLFLCLSLWAAAENYSESSKDANFVTLTSKSWATKWASLSLSLSLSLCVCLLQLKITVRAQKMQTL